MSVYSGFTVLLNGKWYWMSASHVFEDIDRNLKSRHAECLSDYKLEWLVPRAIDDVLIFTYRPGIAVQFDRIAKKIIKESNPDGEKLEALQAYSRMDIGALQLSVYDASILASQGVKPLDRDATRSLSPDEQATFLQEGGALVLAGLPTESIKHTGPKSGTISLIVVPIKGPSRKRNRGTAKRPFYRVEPDWSRDVHDGDVKGMSGGPILAANAQGVRLVAVQSGRLGSPGKIPKTLTIIPSEYCLDTLANAASHASRGVSTSG